MDYIILDNIIPKTMAENFEKTMTSNMFPWFLNRTTVYDEKSNQDSPLYRDVSAFAHLFSNNDGVVSSPYFNIAKYLLDKFLEETKLECKSIVRCRANYMVCQPSKETLPCPPHVDGDYPHHVLLYYVNDSDGDTVLYQNGEVLTTVNPVQGRFLFFSGSDMHSATPPNKHDKRIAINYNLEMKL